MTASHPFAPGPDVWAQHSCATTAEALWRVISQRGGLTTFHPYVAANPASRWPGVGSRDVIAYHNGLRLRREFREWHPGRGYLLDIGTEDRHLGRVRWQIRERDGGGSCLRITLTPDLDELSRRTPRSLRPAAWALVLGPQLRRYLDSVVRGAVWVAETGEPVRRNQFGSHRMFSARRARVSDRAMPPTGMPGRRSA
ncbi:MAG: hypothetical protein ACRCSN_07425 [Dermatophilaceae bacterium]